MRYCEMMRELKDKSGLSSRELSEKSGVPLSTINRIMSGQTEAPTFQTTCDLLWTFGASLDEFSRAVYPEHYARLSGKGGEVSKSEESHGEGAKQDEAVYKALADQCQKQNASRGKWLIAVFCVVLVLIAALIFDLLRADVGFFVR